MRSVGLLSSLLFALALLGSPPATAIESTKRYPNCAALLKDYPTGVAKNRRAARRAERLGNERPAVNRSVYRQNRGRDGDRDKVACEQSTYPHSAAGLDEQFRVTKQCIESIGAPTSRADSNVMVVAGHGYGKIGGENPGLHPQLSDALNRLADEASVLALTGDISRSGTVESFEAIKAELNDWPTVLISPGNHDVGSPKSREAFKQSFGSTWGSRKVGDVLILWLDTDLDDWRISGDQLTWLEQELRSPASTTASSIILLTHHLIWSRGDRSDFPINGGPRDPSASRDPDQLQRLLQPLGKPSLVISGDTGAFDYMVSIACDQRGTVSYVASGVGGGQQDAVLAVDLTESPAVRVCKLSMTYLEDCVTDKNTR